MSDTQSLCQCGHAREAHEHYRRGTDCGICGRDTCRAFTANPQAQSSTDAPSALRPAGPEAHSA